ncbi:cytochrome P450 [Lentinus tigrinus ALCF2SS1-7]|uniref:Cytochrome P450 n=1 Tax=Lentinus tigrinus ALCF2SS1-6 TaxID=1328759 RepID=A0A5C2SR95_9APHY|nr:cytochrome P450 [Lentinus tigrinus ALCF2SS1-6]RPD79806.1 cytochrome P450 [Lentinus tigrinus ALCF2SS1-7]
MAFSSADLLISSLCVLSSLWLWARSRRARQLPHPPGPRGLPLVGNLFDIPSPQAFPWETYLEWGRQHDSAIIRVSALGMNVVVANTLEVANELLDKRSAIYSDRPRMVMLCELVGFGWGTAFMPYGDPWRDSRRMAHHEFSPSSVKRFRPNEHKATRRFLFNMYHHPEKMMDNLRHLAGATILSIGYDIDVKSLHDHWIVTAEAAADSISETTNAGSYLVDVVPILKHLPVWFPGAGFQKQARTWRASVDRLLNAPYEDVQRRLVTDEVGDCAAKSLIEAFGRTPKDPAYTDYIMRATLGSLYVGGADTTVSALGSFFLAMVLNPEIQEKARKELDHVVGSHRLPEFSDEPSLPYIDAIVKETLRWNPVVPLGDQLLFPLSVRQYVLIEGAPDVPHMLTEDDVYNGYFLPKGTLVVANTWAILHDAKAYPEPSKYNPDRFLRPDGTLDPSVRDPSVAAFGFGRRICPGRFMAVDSIWITIASVLSMFEIRKAVGEDGKQITPDGEYHRAFLCHPKPFPCVIKPRSKEHEVLLMELAQQDA